ncbi:MAG: DMT family transporter [Clostridiaceae bacterium]|nr:DMT family transporter [Clostridiaceae bacterium]
MVTKKQWIANGLLLLTAAIWGFAFVSQKVGAEHVGAFTYNGVRFTLGGLVLWPVIVVLDRKSPPMAEVRRQTLRTGLVAGLILCTAASLQQIGVAYTTAGKAGFLTGLYVVLVPVFGFLFLRQRVKAPVIAGMLLAAGGIYLLSVTEAFTIGRGDLLVLLAAVLWAVHILYIDHYADRIHALRMSSIQFLVTGLLSLLIALITEPFSAAAFLSALPAILYGGLFSVGVGYTLQVIAQKNAKPAHAAILLSMESVFGALGGALLLQERMGVRGAVGCALVFIAILLSQKQ